MACARVSMMALLAALPLSPLSAKITLDGTMGPAGPLAGPAFTISDTLGATQGTNKQVVERGHSVAEVASRLGMTSHSLYAWQVLACTHVGGKCCAPLLKARV